MLASEPAVNEGRMTRLKGHMVAGMIAVVVVVVAAPVPVVDRSTNVDIAGPGRKEE